MFGRSRYLKRDVASPTRCSTTTRSEVRNYVSSSEHECQFVHGPTEPGLPCQAELGHGKFVSMLTGLSSPPPVAEMFFFFERDGYRHTVPNTSHTSRNCSAYGPINIPGGDATLTQNKTPIAVEICFCIDPHQYVKIKQTSFHKICLSPELRLAVKNATSIL